jgi:hypothetical protein
MKWEAIRRHGDSRNWNVTGSSNTCLIVSLQPFLLIYL